MNIAQHLILTLVFILGFSARAQEESAPEQAPAFSQPQKVPAQAEDITPETPPTSPNQAAPAAKPSAENEVSTPDTEATPAVKPAPVSAASSAAKQAPTGTISPAAKQTTSSAATSQTVKKTATPSVNKANTPQVTAEPDSFSAPVEADKTVQQQSQTPVQQQQSPVARRSLLKNASNKEYNKEMYFDQLDNGVLLPPLELEYDLATSNGNSLTIGNAELSAKSFYFALVPMGKAHPQLSKVMGSDAGSKVALVMVWPEKLFNHGTLEMISRTGAVLWSHDFSKQDQEAWLRKLENWKKELGKIGVPADDLKNAGLFQSQFAIEDVKAAGGPFWKQRESFRFCLTQQEGRNQTKICSEQYGARSDAHSVMMGKVRTDPTTPRVLFQNQDAPMKNSVAVSAESPVAFFVELSTGESYEFVTLPNKLELMDISDTSAANTLRIIGYGTRPLQRSILLNPDQYTAITKLIGFEATIGDQRKFWASALHRDDPKIYLPGQGGGIFKQRFELSQIPGSQARPYLSRRTPTGTYIDGIELEGRKMPSAKVTSQQNSVKVDKKNPTLFTWNFKATERGEINRSYLDVNYQGKNYRSYYEIYKGFPRELSGRFTAVKTQGDFVILGEVAYNQWFEDLLGWTNYWVSRQRWGISAKYFQSFTDLKVSSGKTAPLSAYNVDLKYRLVPGLWGRDESVGLMASYQNVTFDQLKAPMLGGGVFWGRSMPKILDDLFNLMPLFRYPKWVDMEFIYYASSMDSNVTLNSSMSLNFHGKVLWTQRYFGEAGFGMKRYAFTDKSLNQKAELNSFYGTVGLGVNF